MNVEDLLEQKGISFIPKGADYEISCLNPDHADRNPSMRVDRITGIFNCFSCEYKGNLFNYFGEKPNHLQIRREKLKNTIRQKLAESTGLVFPKNSLEYNGNWRNIKADTYQKFDTFTSADKEFVSRLNFPVRDITGKIVAFIGRHTGEAVPKYLISPAGAKLPLYPVVQPKNGSVILVEGIFDMVNLHDKGLDNAMCCFGTKQVNERKLEVLSISGVSHIDIFFDGDEAGQSAAERIKEMCESIGLSVRNVHLKGTDPGALTQQQITKLKSKLYA